MREERYQVLQVCLSLVTGKAIKRLELHLRAARWKKQVSLVYLRQFIQYYVTVILSVLECLHFKKFFGLFWAVPFLSCNIIGRIFIELRKIAQHSKLNPPIDFGNDLVPVLNHSRVMWLFSSRRFRKKQVRGKNIPLQHKARLLGQNYSFYTL